MIIYMHEVRYTCFLQYVPVFLISAWASLPSTSLQPHKLHPLILVSIHTAHPQPEQWLTKASALIVFRSQPANCFAFKATMAACMWIANVFNLMSLFNRLSFVTVFTKLFPPLAAFNFHPQTDAAEQEIHDIYACRLFKQSTCCYTLM